MKLNEQVALVTGAGGGLGRAFVKQLVEAGVSRVYAGVRGPAERLAMVQAEMPDATVLPLDITDDHQVGEAAHRCGDVTLLVNNAGVNRVRGLIAATDTDAAREEMAVNYFGTLAMCRAFAPVLAGNGGGVMVNILSILARVNLPLMGSLCASKAAGLSLTQAVRAELAARGTRVVAVMPGAIDTRMSHDFPPPKADPAQVVRRVLAGLEAGEDDIYPDAMAEGLAAQLQHDARAVERELAAMLPNATEENKA